MCFYREVDSEPFLLGIGFCTLVLGTWHHIIPLGEGCIWRLSALGSFYGFALGLDTFLSSNGVQYGGAGNFHHTPYMVVLEALMYAALSILHNPGVCYSFLNSIAGLSVWGGIARYKQDTAFPAPAYWLSTW